MTPLKSLAWHQLSLAIFLREAGQMEQPTVSILPNLAAPKMAMKVPTEMRDLVEQGIGQVEKLFDALIEAANQSVSVIPNPTTDMTKKALYLTERNVKAFLEHAKQLAHANDFKEAMQIQAKFIQSQFAAAAEQIKPVSPARDLTEQPSVDSSPILSALTKDKPTKKSSTKKATKRPPGSSRR